MLHHVMFDVDDTLTITDKFDSSCFLEAVYEVLGNNLERDWTLYDHVSYVGILNQHIKENGLDANKGKILADVKALMIEKISVYLNAKSIQQVPGANEFIKALREMNNVSLSIATGGWQESAIMKLESAGIDVQDIPMASSGDHYIRTEIMKIAQTMAVGEKEISCTYFGDGEWDKLACEELGFNFVLVGQRTEHHQNIIDYRNIDQAMSFIGL